MDYSSLYGLMLSTPLEKWIDELRKKNHELINASGHGDLEKWLNVLEQLPEIEPSTIQLNSDSIIVGDIEDVDETTRNELIRLLYDLHPWRKGPFSVFGSTIDTEWRSDMKWNRLKEYIQPLNNRLVLDVGCGSGYHCWRMAGENAKLVIGIDPTLRYVMQFFAMQKYIKNPGVHVLPLNIDDVPDKLDAFDTVFSMGVLYHRRSPIDHLYKLKACLKPGGELVIESLVIDGGQNEVLVPDGRYAKMRNVWFIPSCSSLEVWLKRAGFSDVKLINVNQTTTQEQRVTDWMKFESLSGFLDPANTDLTVEGYPAPMRAIFTAKKT